MRAHLPEISRPLLVLAGILALATLVWAADGPAEEPSSAMRFIEGLAVRVGFEVTSCGAAFATVPGRLRCGFVTTAAVEREAHREALRMAEEGAGVLDVQSMTRVPPYQLADLPGFDPLPDPPGWHGHVYLIDRHRVAVWIEVPGNESAGAERDSRRRVMFSVEELDGPFPWNLPALDHAGLNGD